MTIKIPTIQEKMLARVAIERKRQIRSGMGGDWPIFHQFSSMAHVFQGDLLHKDAEHRHATVDAIRAVLIPDVTLATPEASK
jgi:hypothetical protein